MAAYYNEHDPFAAAWLRELIRDGLIAPGDVDERDIQQVQADDIRGYAQCHFFAGIGGWSYALRLAGWPDHRPVWTGSCPCQPLSSAGQRKGHADQRHLWPAFYRLIAERAPSVVFGEQVGGALGYEWLAGIRADLEHGGYVVGAADLPAAGVGSPHIRQRLYWVADSLRSGTGHAPGQGVGTQATPDGKDGRLSGQRLRAGIEGASGDGLGDADNARSQRRIVGGNGAGERPAGPAGMGFWSRAEWLACSDGKARRVEPTLQRIPDGLPGNVVSGGASHLDSFPLAVGAKHRVGRLRGYGNAIVPQAAAEFIGAWLETRE